MGLYLYPDSGTLCLTTCGRNTGRRPGRIAGPVLCFAVPVRNRDPTSPAWPLALPALSPGCPAGTLAVVGVFPYPFHDADDARVADHDQHRGSLCDRPARCSGGGLWSTPAYVPL